MTDPLREKARVDEARTTEADVDLIVEVVRQLAQREAQGLLSSAV